MPLPPTCHGPWISKGDALCTALAPQTFKLRRLRYLLAAESRTRTWVVLEVCFAADQALVRVLKGLRPACDPIAQYVRQPISVQAAKVSTVRGP